MEFVRLAARHGRAMVIGTTGLSPENLAELKELSRNFPCVQSPNMSICVNVLFKLVKKTAAILGDDYDIEIIEAHHNRKKDAPSGTALKLGEMAAAGVNRNLKDVAVFERNGIIGERKPHEIGIQSIRAADIVGEHTIFYAGPGERLELSHRAHSRDHFAKGAARRRPGSSDRNAASTACSMSWGCRISEADRWRTGWRRVFIGLGRVWATARRC